MEPKAPEAPAVDLSAHAPNSVSTAICEPLRRTLNDALRARPGAVVLQLGVWGAELTAWLARHSKVRHVHVADAWRDDFEREEAYHRFGQGLPEAARAKVSLIRGGVREACAEAARSGLSPTVVHVDANSFPKTYLDVLREALASMPDAVFTGNGHAFADVGDAVALRASDTKRELSTKGDYWCLQAPSSTSGGSGGNGAAGRKGPTPAAAATAARPGGAADPFASMLDQFKVSTKRIKDKGRGVHKSNASAPVFSGKKKLAFLIVTIGDHNCIDLWQDFFADAAEGSYELYVHPKHYAQVSQQLLKPRCVRAVETSYLHSLPSVVECLRMALRDPQNYKFMVLSESCVPIKPFAEVYEALTRDGSSWIDWWEVSTFDRNERLNVLSAALQSAAVKHSSYYCLNRADARSVIASCAVDDFIRVPVGVEFVLSTIPRERRGASRLMTYVDWEFTWKRQAAQRKELKRLGARLETASEAEKDGVRREIGLLRERLDHDNSHPRDFDTFDLQYFLKLAPGALFARKINRGATILAAGAAKRQHPAPGREGAGAGGGAPKRMKVDDGPRA